MVDNNVGKLAKWLRMMGYDTLFLDDSDDSPDDSYCSSRRQGDTNQRYPDYEKRSGN